MTKVVIIGGGPSGLISGILLARGGAAVTILEANDNPGRKLLASGNGRCNLTNLHRTYGDLRGRDPAFNNRVLDRFTVQDTLDFFHSIGLLTMDRAGWVYPVTGQSRTVLELLMLEASRLKIKIKTNEKAIRIEKQREPSGYLVFTKGWHYSCDRVIVACGSPASAVKGSSRDALNFAGQFDIAAEDFHPALVPLRIKENFGNRWNGTRVRASVRILSDDKEIASEAGELQLTNYGISGIPVMQVSRFALASAASGKKTQALMDFLPDLEREELIQELCKRRNAFPERSEKQLLIGLLPDKLIDLVAEEAAVISKDKNTSIKGTADTERTAVTADIERTAVTADIERSAVTADIKRSAVTVDVIKNFAVTIKADAAMDMAQVCSGGILTRELTDNMEARKALGLYFVGEAVDNDGTCGGYNLQWAWSTGALAAADILQKQASEPE